MPSLHVSGSAFGASASIERVAPLDSPPQPPSASPYRLVGFNATGQLVANVAMIQGLLHADNTGNGLSLDGVIPAAGVVRVAIVRAGRDPRQPDAQRERPHGQRPQAQVQARACDIALERRRRRRRRPARDRSSTRRTAAGASSRSGPARTTAVPGSRALSVARVEGQGSRHGRTTDSWRPRRRRSGSARPAHRPSCESSTPPGGSSSRTTPRSPSPGRRSTIA